MKLYRCIGENELKLLLRGYPIHGMFPSGDITGGKNNLKKRSVVCFYTEPFCWRDENHKYVITLDIPENKLSFGTATYDVSKNVLKTRIWTGRYGSERLVLTEAYVDTYSIKNVTKLYLCDHFAKWYRDEFIIPQCQEYNIEYDDTTKDILLM